MTMLSLTNIFLRMGIIFTLYTNAFVGRNELRYLQVKSCPIIGVSHNMSGVMVIVAGIGHGDTSSNPGLVAFHIAQIPLGKV